MAEEGMSFNPSLSERFARIEPAGLGGTYGSLFRAWVDAEGEGPSVALKKIRGSRDHGVQPTTLRELALLRELQHPNIVELKEVFSLDAMYLCFEWVEQDLHRFIRKQGKLSIRLAKSLLRQLLLGLDYTHRMGVFHRDLKPANLLIEKGHLKIADWGLARGLSSVPVRPLTREVVTLWYRAPELLLGSRQYSDGVDMWSVGCILVEMLNGRAIWPGESEIEQLFFIFRDLGTPCDSTWDGVKDLKYYSNAFPQWPSKRIHRLCPALAGDDAGQDLFRRLFCYDPQRRISAREALQHPWLAEKIDPKAEVEAQQAATARRKAAAAAAAGAD